VDFNSQTIMQEERQRSTERCVETLWFSKQRVQQSTVQYLEKKSYRIVQIAKRADTETGKEIVAEGNAGPLWITVKGFSEDPHETKSWPSFKEAVFQLLAWKAEDETSNAQVAIALPDVPRYRKLAKDIAWMRRLVAFTLIWVNESGKVSVQPSLPKK
jgi:hypothetical protein